MRIDFECSGGYANLRLSYKVDTNEVPREIGAELLSLVESSNLFALDESKPGAKTTGYPDAFQYTVTVCEGDKKKSLSFNDVTAPASLRPLLSRLQELALERRGQ